MFIFLPLFTIFVLLAGGYFAKKTGVLKQKQARTFLDFTVAFALPCLIFDKAYHLNFDFSLIILIFIGFFSCIFSGCLVLIIGKICNFSKATLISMFLLSCFGNTIFLGMPIITGIFEDPQFSAEVILYDALATTLPISLFGPFILSLGNGKKVNLAVHIKKILTFPPFLALFFGFLCKFITLPDFIFTPIRLFGGTATPLALFAIGLGLGFMAIKTAYKPTILVIFAKMILTPIIFICCLKLFGFKLNTSAIVAIIESATPTMTLTAAIIMKAKLDSNLAVSAVAFGVLFAFISIPILVWILL
ncbi:AEC family transporter [Campylobacter sp. VicNov18]|uniref:AEC family transporter n=1 Tax=Campylobacter bilis TaxID=2691918 RepID=UPI001327EF66|nr:AEC family transporter [Campylobacter bilis]MPV63884.1 AEC family transporter [Campylobacter hepaticus]MBM0637385.1 AEC family transporter [Campylobacter bilis]MCC8278106.1 AEC family transporter [Campylobacter bilis]MCC8299610.1 AEC family transporter [Campylobacter bilis]MCC8301015.1 AEC family transporter [Campylobacter bilis]